MAETATQDRPNTVTIEDAGPSRKKVSIEIPAETVDEKLGDSLDTLALEAQIPGFRKGKAPRSLIEKKFGSAVREEAKNQLVASAYQSAIEEHKLRVVGDPIAEDLADVEVETGKPLAFSIDVEVSPEFELPSLEGIKIKRPSFDVTDEMIDSEVEKLCINEGELEERDAPEPGDYLTGHGIMTGGKDDDGNPREFYNIKGAVVQVPDKDAGGKGMILGVLVEDFEKQLGLPKPGETATIKVKGPENHEVEDIRGEDLTITFEVERVDRIIPAKPEDIVGTFGFESADQLKDALRTRLTQRAIVRQQSAMRQQVSDYLIDNTTLELPERLTDRQAARTLERRRMELMYRGVSATDIETHMAELRAASDEVAQRELKLFFILNQAAEDMEIGVDEAEINGRIAQMAMEQGERPEKLRKDLIAGNRVGAIYQQIREHKAMDAILAKADIEDTDGAEGDE